MLIGTSTTESARGPGTDYRKGRSPLGISLRGYGNRIAGTKFADSHAKTMIQADGPRAQQRHQIEAGPLGGAWRHPAGIRLGC
jgi:hypothetical protein